MLFLKTGELIDPRIEGSSLSPVSDALFSIWCPFADCYCSYFSLSGISEREAGRSAAPSEILSCEKFAANGTS